MIVTDYSFFPFCYQMQTNTPSLLATSTFVSNSHARYHIKENNTFMKLEWLKWFHEEITEMTDADRKEKNTKVNTPDWPGDVKLIFSIQRSKEKWSIWKECVRVSLYHFNHGCSIPQRLTVWRVICSSSLIKVWRKVILMNTKFQWLNIGLRILSNTRKYILDYSCFPWNHILC